MRCVRAAFHSSTVTPPSPASITSCTSWLVVATASRFVFGAFQSSTVTPGMLASPASCTPSPSRSFQTRLPIGCWVPEGCVRPTS